MIAGIGTDIVSISRIAKVLSRRRERFPTVILHPDEMSAFAASHQPENFLAKRFAAKEAFSKALGIGMRRGFDFPDLLIQHDEQGKPYFVFTNKVTPFLEQQRITQSHLSLSDDNDMAIAFVVLERELL